MWSLFDIQRWLDDSYPDLLCRQLPEGAWCIEQRVLEPTVMELDPSWEYDGIAYHVECRTLVFRVANRLPGGWVCDEIVKRDPRLASNPGNHYHDAYLLSLQAEKELELRNASAQESARNMWETARRCEPLMNRVAAHLTRGDTESAWREFSPETMLKHALKENPRELRQRDFWRSV